MTAIIDEIFDLFARFGGGHYGEALSLESHMIQSAVRAQSLGAPDAVIVAALLHDIGYFLHPDSAGSIEAGRNIGHEALGAAWLSQAFGPEVTAPVALHVEAKRYLCRAEPGYFDQLSEASRLSLAVQGGVMSAEGAAAFAKHASASAAILLRRCDDHGKDVSLSTPSLADFRALVTAALR